MEKPNEDVRLYDPCYIMSGFIILYFYVFIEDVVLLSCIIILLDLSFDSW